MDNVSPVSAEELKHKQVEAQCKAVVHMADVLAKVHRDYCSLFHGDEGGALVDIVGERSAQLMELLGDILNGMDAVSEEDEWMDPIFERSQEMFPIKEMRSTPTASGGKVPDSLFEAIKHGDKAHQVWLKAAIGAYFSGVPMPEYVAAAPAVQADHKEINDLTDVTVIDYGNTGKCPLCDGHGTAPVWVKQAEQPQAALSDAQIEKIWTGLKFKTKWSNYMLAFARALLSQQQSTDKAVARDGGVK